MAPIVRRAEDGDLQLVKLSWGFVLLRDGYAPKRVTNVRDDQIRQKRLTNEHVVERARNIKKLLPSYNRQRAKRGLPPVAAWTKSLELLEELVTSDPSRQMLRELAQGRPPRRYHKNGRWYHEQR